MSSEERLGGNVHSSGVFKCALETKLNANGIHVNTLISMYLNIEFDYSYQYSNTVYLHTQLGNYLSCFNTRFV